ncbi:hypothetical protein EsH8_I_000115 [Colletotrichum jinshuiense]
MSSPTLTFYFKRGACSLASHSLLHHLSMPFTPVEMKNNGNRQVEAADGSLTYEEYLKVNPAGLVPAIVVDGGEVITEQTAVLTYIVSVASAENQKLLGTGPLHRARVVEWLTWLSGTFHGTAVTSCTRPNLFADGEEAKKDVLAKGWERILACYARVEERLKGREFAVGDELTVVDFYLYVFRRWAVYMTGLGGSQFGEKFPSFEKLGRKIEALEGVQKTLKIEDQKPVYE